MDKLWHVVAALFVWPSTWQVTKQHLQKIMSLLGAALEIALEHLEESHSKLSIRKCVGERVAAAVQVAHVVRQVVEKRRDALSFTEPINRCHYVVRRPENCEQPDNEGNSTEGLMCSPFSFGLLPVASG